jgi:hypothetical protein
LLACAASHECAACLPGFQDPYKSVLLHCVVGWLCIISASMLHTVSQLVLSVFRVGGFTAMTLGGVRGSGPSVYNCSASSCSCTLCAPPTPYPRLLCCSFNTSCFRYTPKTLLLTRHISTGLKLHLQN